MAITADFKKQQVFYFIIFSFYFFIYFGFSETGSHFAALAALEVAM